MTTSTTTNNPETALPGEPKVRSSAWLEVLCKYWNERIQRKRATAQKMAENGEYALAHRLAVEADATELCLKDLETESTSNDQAQAQPPKATPERKGDNQ